MTTRKKLPKGWRWAKLDAALEIDNQGIRPAAGTVYRYIGLENIEGGLGDFIEIPEVDGQQIGSGKYIFGERHILYGKLRPYLNKVALPEFNGICSTDILPLLPKSGMSKEYLAYCLRSKEFVDYATQYATGTKMPRLGPDKLLAAIIPLPPTEAEQERIVEVLRQADAIRRKRAEARRLADQILPALFLDMFGDPISNPKNWPVDRLGNYIAEWQAGFASGKKDVENGVRQLRMNNITTSGWINLDLVRTVARHKKHEHYLAQKGDVIFNNTNSPDLVGKTILFLEEGEFYFSNHLSRIRTTERVTNEWLAGLLHVLWAKDVFKGLCRQWVNQASVSKESVFALEVPIPSPTALQNHQEALEYVSTRRDAFAISNEDAERLFSVLLSRACTGELTAQDMDAIGGNVD